MHFRPRRRERRHAADPRSLELEPLIGVETQRTYQPANGDAFIQHANLKPFLKNTRRPEMEIFAGVRLNWKTVFFLKTGSSAP